jgi:uncharacterized protein (TIGR02246 family)
VTLTQEFAMMSRFVSRFSITMLLALAGCAQQNDFSGDSAMKKQNEDIEAIKQLAETWRSGWLAGDVDLLLSLYADEPVLLPQDQPVVVGKAAIRPLYEAVLKEFDFQSQGTVKEVVVSGDMGYFWSAYTLTATPKVGGEPMKVTGKSLFIVKREPGGAWKIARLMDNSDGVTTSQDKQQKGEPDGAANGSQPMRSETNSTSSAADSRR